VRREAAQRNFCPGGRRNPLKRLDWDKEKSKEIQGFFFDFLCASFAGFG
jgi:hypothetical protein